MEGAGRKAVLNKGKGKVILGLKHCAMKASGGVEVMLYHS
jgi:hypothetical protein